MTGMKEGAGEDPFADDESADAESENEAEEQATPSVETTEATTNNSESQSEQRAARIPYKFRRDSVHDGRNRVPLFLKPETKRMERDAQRELEERFDDEVSLTDLRESLMKVGLQHLDEVEANLETWGYGLTFDE